ncbi:putative F-box protein, partial [Mucuna pruriens]
MLLLIKRDICNYAFLNHGSELSSDFHLHLVFELCSAFEEDIWTEIAKFLDGKSLVMLAATSRWFRRAIMDDGIWKFVCLRDLQVPPPERVAFKWCKLYTSAFDGSHSYMFRQQEKHIGEFTSFLISFYIFLNNEIRDWMRIGAFSFDSSVAVLTERLTFPGKIRKGETMEKMLRSQGCCVLDNVKSGIWIADLQLVRCPVCDLNTCDGTMQTLDARHIELFLYEGYRSGSWDYQLVGSHDIKKRADGAAGSIFDIKHLEDSSTSAVFDYKSWIGRPNDWQPKAMIAFHAVAVNTNLQENEVPVARPEQQYEKNSIDELSEDLRLTWDRPNCRYCESREQLCGFDRNNNNQLFCYSYQPDTSRQGVQVFRIITLCIAGPAAIFAIVMACCVCYKDRLADIHNHAIARSAAATISPAPQESIVSTGLDESTIESYEKVVLGESRRLPGPNNGCCWICLSEYSSKETIRLIPECKHCFHAECIDEWLRINTTCPVCRNSPSPSPLHLTSINP